MKSFSHSIKKKKKKQNKYCTGSQCFLAPIGFGSYR